MNEITQQPDMPVFTDETAAYVETQAYQTAVKYARAGAVTLPADANADDVGKALLAGRAVRFEPSAKYDSRGKRRHGYDLAPPQS